jgi:hypothetical protein
MGSIENYVNKGLFVFPHLKKSNVARVFCFILFCFMFKEWNQYETGRVTEFPPYDFPQTYSSSNALLPEEFICGIKKHNSHTPTHTLNEHTHQIKKNLLMTSQTIPLPASLASAWQSFGSLCQGWCNQTLRGAGSRHSLAELGSVAPST